VYAYKTSTTPSPCLKGTEFRAETVHSRTACANTGTYAATFCTIARGSNQGIWAGPTRSARGPRLESLSHLCRKYRRLCRFCRLCRFISTEPSIFCGLSYSRAWKRSSVRFRRELIDLYPHQTSWDGTDREPSAARFRRKAFPCRPTHGHRGQPESNRRA